MRTSDRRFKICSGIELSVNSVLWNDKITMKTKKMIFSTILESIVTYGLETWEINKRNENRLKALELDFWRRACGISRLEHVLLCIKTVKTQLCFHCFIYISVSDRCAFNTAGMNKLKITEASQIK